MISETQEKRNLRDWSLWKRQMEDSSSKKAALHYDPPCGATKAPCLKMTGTGQATGAKAEAGRQAQERGGAEHPGARQQGRQKQTDSNIQETRRQDATPTTRHKKPRQKHRNHANDTQPRHSTPHPATAHRPTRRHEHTTNRQTASETGWGYSMAYLRIISEASQNL